MAATVRRSRDAFGELFPKLLTAKHNGEPITIDFNPDQLWNETETPGLELALRVLEHYTTSITTQTGKDGSEIVMAFEASQES